MEQWRAPREYYGVRQRRRRWAPEMTCSVSAQAALVLSFLMPRLPHQHSLVTSTSLSSTSLLHTSLSISSHSVPPSMSRMLTDLDAFCLSLALFDHTGQDIFLQNAVQNGQTALTQSSLELATRMTVIFSLAKRFTERYD